MNLVVLYCIFDSIHYILLSNSIFILQLFIHFYFSNSYFSYFNDFTLSTINWLFILVLTVFSFNGRKVELIFFSRLFVGSIFVITLQTFLVQLSAKHIS